MQRECGDASVRNGDNFKRFKNCCLTAKALTVLYVPNSLDSGYLSSYVRLIDVCITQLKPKKQKKDT